MEAAERAGLRRKVPLLLAAVLLLSGCIARDGVAVGPSDRPGIPRTYVTRCGSERVTSVRLALAGPDESDPDRDAVVLWQIDTHPGQPISHVNVGETPTGFVAVVPARLPLPAHKDLWLTVESGVQGNAGFRLDELEPGTVNWEGRNVSFASFRHGAYYGGKCASEAIFPTWVSDAFGGLCFLAAGVLILLVIRWSRRRPRKPPPSWHPDPWGQSRLRWWDGQAWSGHVHS